MKNVPGCPSYLDRKSRLGQRVYSFLHGSGFYPSSRQYNLTISHESRFIWFRVAKAGTRTTLAHLRKHAILDVDQVFASYYPERRYAAYFKFAFVRNPWDRLVSAWLNKVVEERYAFGVSPSDRERMKDFGEFIAYVESLDVAAADVHLRLQSELIDLNNLDFLGRMESFRADFVEVMERVGLPTKMAERRNTSEGRRPYQEYYTPQQAQKVARIYGRDVRLFNYRFE